MVKIAAVILLIFSAVVHAGSPILVDRQIGKYLGTLSSNPYDQNSVSNPHGKYGSQYSKDSINNPVGEYGSPYSDKSINNPYAINPPIILDPDEYHY
jgi:hypothetical protein